MDKRIETLRLCLLHCTIEGINEPHRIYSIQSYLNVGSMKNRYFGSSIPESIPLR